MGGRVIPCPIMHQELAMYSRFPVTFEALMWMLAAACLIGALFIAPMRDQSTLLFWMLTAFTGWQGLEMRSLRIAKSGGDAAEAAGSR